MDALKIPAIEPLRERREAGDRKGRESGQVSLTPHLKKAFATLGEAFLYARELHASPWQFAVEIGSLRRLSVSNSDLRRLLEDGLIEHAIETTLSRDAKRSFRHNDRAIFEKRSCFVLTDAGYARCEALRCHGSGEPLDHDDDGAIGSRVDGLTQSEADGLREAGQPAMEPSRDSGPAARACAPKWDRDRHELFIGTVLVKRFTIPSTNAEAILAAFEELSWPQHIEDPLPACDELTRKARLHEAVDFLNRTLRRPLVRFLRDEIGREIHWELCGSPSNVARA
jgi:hypothetical protein